MNSQKELKNEISTVSTIQSITSVYQGIASLRMNQIKDSVAENKKFIDGIAEIYGHAKTAYLADIQKQLKSKDREKKNDLSFIRRNGKSVLVLVSANEHLYGTLIIDVWRKFSAELREKPGDSVVIGNFGKSLIVNEVTHTPIQYFDLADDNPDPAQIKKIIQFITQYETVIVHFGQMRTLLTQEPTRVEITGGVALDKPIETPKKYIFEPTPAKIMEFFESEIIATLFNEKLLEHQLARFSSRMVAMDQATQNAGSLQTNLKKDLTNIKRRLTNIRQLEVFSGMSIWGKEKK
ncbi:MAG: F0F1 ATP synthase subunit gamma [bacterium]|nr:F0F1 ATP synthase subunit gamma [bacterium]